MTRRGDDHCEISWVSICDIGSDSEVVRTLKISELKDLTTLIGFVRGNFRKRLETYYKKYSKSIALAVIGQNIK